MSQAYTIIGTFCAALLFALAACEREPTEKPAASTQQAVPGN